MIWTRRLLPLGLAAAIATLLGLGWFVLGYDLSILGYPLGLGLFAIAMAVLAAAIDWRPAAAEAPPKNKAMFDESEELLDKGETWVQFGWLTAGIALCLLLGFAAGPALLVAAYLKWARRSWPVAAGGGAAAGAAVWGMFGPVLNTTLPMLPLFLR